MGIKQLYKDNLRKLPNEYGDVSVMSIAVGSYLSHSISLIDALCLLGLPLDVHYLCNLEV